MANLFSGFDQEQQDFLLESLAEKLTDLFADDMHLASLISTLMEIIEEGDEDKRPEHVPRLEKLGITLAKHISFIEGF